MDFFLAVLQPILKWCQPRVKVILLSASIYVKSIIKYFNPCPFHLVISSQTPQVQELYIEDILENLDLTIRSKSQKRQLDGTRQVDELDAEYERMMAPYMDIITPKLQSPSPVITSLKNRESEESPVYLIMLLLKHICSQPRSGAILLFLPGKFIY